MVGILVLPMLLLLSPHPPPLQVLTQTTHGLWYVVEVVPLQAQPAESAAPDIVHAGREVCQLVM